MSLLAHATAAANGEEQLRARKEMAKTAQREVVDAKRIQRQTGCTWTNALLLAAGKSSGHVVFVTVKG